MVNYINSGLLQVVAGIICMLNLYQFTVVMLYNIEVCVCVCKVNHSLLLFILYPSTFSLSIIFISVSKELLAREKRISLERKKKLEDLESRFLPFTYLCSPSSTSSHSPHPPRHHTPTSLPQKVILVTFHAFI